MFLHQMVHKNWRGRRGCVYENETRINVFFNIWTFLRKLFDISSHTHTYICYWYSSLWFFIWPFNYCLETWRNLKTSVFHFTFQFNTWLFNHHLESWRNLGVGGRTKTKNQAKATYNSKIGIEYLTSFSGLPAPHLTKGVTGENHQFT